MISQDLFVAALEQSVDAIYLIDPSSAQIRYANRAACDSVGLTPGEIVSKRVHDLQTRVVSDPQWRQVLEVMRAEKRLLFRGEHRHADGSTFPVEVHSTIVDHADGEVIISVVRDMSSWDEQERQLRRSETTFRAVLDTMNEGVLVLDPVGRFTIANPAFCQLTGIDRDQIEGRKPIDNWPVIREDGSEYPGDQLPSWRTLKTREPVVNDIQGVIRPDGETCWLLAHSEPLNSVDSGEFEGVVVTLSNITELKRKESELARQARADALTGNPNRFAFVEALAAELASRPSHTPLAVLFLDIDNFKAVNDSMGHETGDDLLVEIARRFADRVAQGERIARLGGDEFITYMSLESGESAATRARQILDALHDPFDVGGRQLFVSGSIGIALYPRDGEQAGALMKHADIAMYRAKKEGRNRYRYYSSDLGASADQTLTLGSELRQAINEGQFELQYQPIVQLRDGRLHSAEALLRWRHPERGLLLPAEFIDALEQSGMIVELGQWVLHQACAVLAELNAHDGADSALIGVSVNVSAIQFRQTGFVETVQEALGAYGVPAQGLHLELTERVLAEDENAALRLLNRLAELGCRISLDDFGTGYSSLRYLQRLPVSSLKMDRSFLPAELGEVSDLTLARTIISLADNMGLGLVVEGIETEQQLEFLRGEGATLGQGFLFSKAVSAERLMAMRDTLLTSA